MWSVYVVLAVLPQVAVTESGFVYTDGWVPVSNDIVYNQIKHGIVQPPSFVTTHSIQVLNTDVNKVLSKYQQIYDQEENSDELKDTRAFGTGCDADEKADCAYEKEKIIPQSNGELITKRYQNVVTNENNTDQGFVRRSKKITDSTLKNYLQELLIQESLPKVEEKSYKVTEEIDKEDVVKEASELKENGYKYDSPEDQILNNALYNILSKYKINKDDDLKNYALSRRQKSLNTFKVALKPDNNPDSYKYNNLNHLLVDPLLAVFLSNYGYYLQGMYGIHNRYNNLYGYLASNNIHNNRPFGFYKIFSDTDSSH